jgi:CRP-like cAMP-binding protein
MTEELRSSANPAGTDEKKNSQELADSIRQAALRGDFGLADSLRDELMRVDPMNLALIVSTGEIIEEQKTSRLDKDHLAIWRDLYDGCTTEETNGLFYSLQPAVIEANKLLQVQGKISSRLFFIDSGKVALFYRQDGKNKVAVQLGRGDIVGEESFFEISLCSMSAATQSEVRLYSLIRDSALKWPELYPGLYEKLGEFCRATGKSKLAVQQKELDRRSSTRYLVAGKASAVILDKGGQPTDTYVKGGLSDISPAGLCFDIKCSNQEAARALLAQNVALSLEFDGQPGEPLKLRGLVTKVSFHMHNDYSVHVKLNRPMGQETFSRIPVKGPADGK